MIKESLRDKISRRTIDYLLDWISLYIAIVSIALAILKWHWEAGVACLAWLVVAFAILLYTVEEMSDGIFALLYLCLVTPVAVFCVISLSNTLPTFEQTGVTEWLIWSVVVGFVYALHLDENFEGGYLT